jgi:hypothetical protein
MTQPTHAPPPRGIAVTLVGILTLLYGLLFIAIGVAFFVYGTAVLDFVMGRVNEATLTEDQRKALEDGRKFLTSFLAIFAGCNILWGLLPFISSFGVLMRKNWGRVIAIIFALLTLLAAGYALYKEYEAPGAINDKLIPFATSGAFALYGLLTIIVLLVSGREFAPAQQQTY